ncbi:ADP-ribosylation factor-like 3 [Strigomonas culicis]|uniref:ADP-ribosylation factor-like 3 n=2 Tax=Strigomonas culicis TaxID=28005 RepID=S9W560_9TRYP|nr:ADP-ribosylation factor-like 3 [Strigomonas culicis]|eukprot:EPY31020.1 ADP-ribosylation factor-like 3 [Strigomonas culicis]
MGFLDYVMRFRPNTQHGEILLLGIDGSGKTSILRQLSDDDNMSVCPTQGFHIKILITGGVKLNVCDMGGQRAARHYWRQYYGEADVAIFVVDAADPRRLLEAKEILSHCLEEEKLAGIPLLVFANKQDMIGALTPEMVSEALNLVELRDRRWDIQGCSAKTGEGLDEGLSWIVKQLHH